MKNLRQSNKYRKVQIENIVFLQGDDYLTYEQEQENSTMSDVDYLLQWYYPKEHEVSTHYAKDINTAFLGKLIKIDGYKGYFLFSKNTHLGYIGLSKVVSFEKEA